MLSGQQIRPPWGLASARENLGHPVRDVAGPARHVERSANPAALGHSRRPGRTSDILFATWQGRPGMLSGQQIRPKEAAASARRSDLVTAQPGSPQPWALPALSTPTRRAPQATET